MLQMICTLAAASSAAASTLILAITGQESIALAGLAVSITLIIVAAAAALGEVE